MAITLYFDSVSSQVTVTVNLLKWRCVWTLQHNLIHYFTQKVPNKCCHGWNGSSAVQLAVLNQPWGKPHNCGHGNQQWTACHSDSLDMLLRNILIIPRKWLYDTRSRSRLPAQWWLTLEHFYNKSQVIWSLNTAEFLVRTSLVSVHLCPNKYAALPVVMNLDCCVKTTIRRPYGNVISQASEKSGEHSVQGVIILCLSFYWHFKPTTQP